MSRRGRSPTGVSLFSFQDIITSVTAIVILLALILAVEFLSRESSASPNDRGRSAARLRQAIKQIEAEIRQLRLRLAEEAERAKAFARASPERLQRECADIRQHIAALQAELEQLRTRKAALQMKRDEMAQEDSLRKEDRRKLAELQAAAEAKHKQLEKLKAENCLIYNPAPETDKQAWVVDVSADRIVAAPLGGDRKPAEFTGHLLASPATEFSTWARKRSVARNYFVLLVRPSGIRTYKTVRSELEDMGFRMGYDVIGSKQTIVGSAREATQP